LKPESVKKSLCLIYPATIYILNTASILQLGFTFLQEMSTFTLLTCQTTAYLQLAESHFGPWLKNNPRVCPG